MSDGNEKRLHTADYGFKLDWCCTLANATDLSYYWPAYT